MPTWLTKRLYGGTAEGKQLDREATFTFAQNLNFRRQHDAITLNQKLTKDSATAIDALPHWIRDLQGIKYAYLQNGKIFERKAAASWVSVKSVTASSGQGLGVDASYLYYVNASYLGRFPVGGTWGTENVDNWQAITASSWNPVHLFSKVNLLCVGSQGNMAVYDYASAGYSGTRLVMPSGWIIRDFEEWGDYLAISCWTGSSIRNSSKGKLVLWDGLSTRFNAVIDSQAGNLLLCQTDKNILNVFAGVIGNIYQLTNGELYQRRKIPFINEDKDENIDIYPGAKTIWQGIPHFGIAGAATAASLTRGVYSFGGDRANLPHAMNMEYTISTDATDSDVKIGALHTAADNEMYIGWGDGATYGIDKVDSSAKFATGYVESLDFHGSITQEGFKKVLSKAHIVHSALISGQSLVVKVKRDDSASWATVMTSSTAGEVSKVVTQLADGTPIPVGRFFKARIEINSVNGVAPEFTSLKFSYDTKPTT